MARIDHPTMTLISAPVPNEVAWALAQKCKALGTTRTQLVRTILTEAVAGVLPTPETRP